MIQATMLTFGKVLATMMRAGLRAVTGETESDKFQPPDTPVELD